LGTELAACLPVSAVSQRHCLLISADVGPDYIERESDKYEVSAHSVFLGTPQAILLDSLNDGLVTDVEDKRWYVGFLSLWINRRSSYLNLEGHRKNITFMLTQGVLRIEDDYRWSICNPYYVRGSSTPSLWSEAHSIAKRYSNTLCRGNIA
jgi:hypothetical protein